MMSSVLTATVGATILLAAFAVAMSITAGLVLGDPVGLLEDLGAAALAQLPAVLVVIAAVTAIFAVLPRRAVVLSWLLAAAAIMLGPLFDLGVPQMVADLSPLAHQKAPSVEVSLIAVIALTTVAVAIAAAGLAAFRRRDLALG